MQRLVLFALLLAACGPQRIDAGRTMARNGGPLLAPTTKEVRREYLRRAHVFQTVAIGERDLLAGPKGPRALPFRAELRCEFYEAAKHGDGAPVHGTSKKFYCSDRDGKKLRVKYDNREIYGSVLATRLFWALGVAADIDYPVRVTCVDCPADPWRVTRRAPRPDHSPRSTRVLEDAIVQQLYPAIPIEVCKEREGERCVASTLDGGWKFAELALVDPDAGGADRAELDAFRLLAAFVAHGDNKHDNQRLICPLDAVGADGLCTQPRLMIADLGNTFGRGASRLLELIDDDSLASLKVWAALPVWKSPERCEAQLSVRDGHSHPVISEAGRALLAEKLGALSDRQLVDLFTAAQVERLHERYTPPGGAEHEANISDWVEVFKAKRTQIVERRCPR